MILKQKTSSKFPDFINKIIKKKLNLKKTFKKDRKYRARSAVNLLSKYKPKDEILERTLSKKNVVRVKTAFVSD